MSDSWDFLANGPDLRGRVALVTGGNSGIGYDTIRLLALRGAKVYMASRTESKARQAMSEMYDRHAEIKPGQLAWVGLDLSDLKTVVAAADHVKANETRLDIIINNACGTTGLDRPTSGSGWEPNLAVK
ncbi:Short-chain dehydrogenase/reductase pyiH like protein [Verticillium longisporum]|nr:Short-chain dehydrogenase/reductase pyiH like protein [Verticillium longisporum]